MLYITHTIYIIHIYICLCKFVKWIPSTLRWVPWRMPSMTGPNYIYISFTHTQREKEREREREREIHQFMLP